MGINIELAKRAEKIARKMAEDAGYGAAAWELFLMEAYQQIMREDREAAPRVGK